MMLIAPPALILTWTAVQRASGAPLAPPWRVILSVGGGLEYMFAALATFLFTHPRARGVHANGSLLLRIPRWRRAAAASLLPIPALTFSVGSIAQGSISPAAVAGVAVVAILTLFVTRERIVVSAAGVDRVAGVGRLDRISWDKVSSLEVWPAGVRLRAECGKSIHVPGLWMDGYPEFVATLLERAPAESLRALPGDVRQKLAHIADLARPGGTRANVAN